MPCSILVVAACVRGSVEVRACVRLESVLGPSSSPRWHLCAALANGPVRGRTISPQIQPVNH